MDVHVNTLRRVRVVFNLNFLEAQLGTCQQIMCKLGSFGHLDELVLSLYPRRLADLVKVALHMQKYLLGTLYILSNISIFSTLIFMNQVIQAKL